VPTMHRIVDRDTAAYAGRGWRLSMIGLISLS
jgi:hypothetical protein